MITTRLWNKPQQRCASALRLWPARESRAPVSGEPRMAALLLTAGARPHPLSPAPCLGVPTSGAEVAESERADSAPSLQRQGRHEGSPLHGTPARGQSTAGPEPRRIRGARAGWEPPRGCVQGGPRRAASTQVERKGLHTTDGPARAARSAASPGQPGRWGGRQRTKPAASVATAGLTQWQMLAGASVGTGSPNPCQPRPHSRARPAGSGCSWGPALFT